VDGATIVDQTVRGLINAGLLKESDQDDIVSTWVFNAPYSYPTPSIERDAILSQVIPYLERTHGIYSRGRFGMWKYEVSNTDHSLMQGVELIDRLLLGESEKTIGIRYGSTDDGRNAATHERSPLAGSGAPKPRTATGYPGHTSAAKGSETSARVPDIAEEELAVTTPPASTAK
jgi:hypothetical protein